MGVGLLALVVGMIIYVVATRRVTGPLAATAGRLDELAQGDADLTVRLPVTSRDEVGMLARAYNVFLDNLHRLVHDIRDTSAHVGTASHQLSGAATQLSAGAQQHASSLEETAASLEEITGTVKQNADNARHANQLAQGARDTAEAGGRVLARAVTAHGGDQPLVAQDLRDHLGHRRDRVPDQPPGAQRGGRSGPGRRAGPRASRWSRRRSGAWPSARPGPRGRSRA